MKRLQVIRVYKSIKSTGGVHRRLLEILPRLAQGVDLRVLCYRERGDRADVLEAAGIPVDVVPTGVKWAPRNVGRYVDYLRDHAPDVVHTHEYTANTLVISAAARAGVPVRVRHLHTMVPWGWGGPVKTSLRVRADRRSARRAGVTLAVSESVRRVYLEGTGLPASSCRVLYNGVDLERFSRPTGGDRMRVRAGWDTPDDAPLTGFVGRSGRGKGGREFLQCARGVRDRVPGARFVMVGAGLEAQLSALVRDLGLETCVGFAGYRDDIPSVLGALDVFVFPSLPDGDGRVQDGLPGVVIEAMAAGLPVVAFDIPPAAELLEGSGGGRIVETGDVARLAEAVGAYLERPGERLAAGAAGRKRAQRFSLGRCVGETLDLYGNLFEEHGRGVS